jgi:hypothetical protein
LSLFKFKYELRREEREEKEAEEEGKHHKQRWQREVGLVLVWRAYFLKAPNRGRVGAGRTGRGARTGGGVGRWAPARKGRNQLLATFFISKSELLPSARNPFSSAM